MSAMPQVFVLTAIARLGRVSGLAWRDVAGTKEALDISTQTMSWLSTSELITFLWALGRLPNGVISHDSIRKGINELHLRNISPGVVSSKDVFLLVRILANAHFAKDEKFNSSKRYILDALIEQLKVWNINNELNNHSPTNTSSNGMKGLLEGQETSTSTSVIEFSLAAVCEIVQTLIDLNLYDKELFSLLSRFLFAKRKNNMSTCAHAFSLGRLEELLRIYEALPMSVKPSTLRYQRGKKILSRFFNGLIR